MDEDLLHEFINPPEAGIDFDRTWNGAYTLVRCEVCNCLILRQRAEKCRQVGGGYEKDLVPRLGRQLIGT